MSPSLVVAIVGLAVTLGGVLLAAGRVLRRLDDLAERMGEHRAESRTQIERLVADLHARTTDGALHEQRIAHVEREVVEARAEAREARHAAKEARHAVELLSARVAREHGA